MTLSWPALADLFDPLTRAESSIDDLARDTLAYLLDAVPGDAVALTLCAADQADGDRLWIMTRASGSMAAYMAAQVRAQLDSSALGSRLHDSAPLLLDPTQLGQHGWTSIIPGTVSHFGLAIGLTIHGQTGGALAIGAAQTNRFGPDELALLRIVAAQLAARLEKMTMTDSHTLAHLAQVERLAAIGGLVAGIAHEIGNPLQAVLIGLQVTREQLADGQPIDSKLIGVIEQDVRRLQRLTGRLLDFARPDRQSARVFNLNQPIEDVLALTAKQMQHARITIHTELTANLALFGNQDQIRQVILNLVINAIEAMPNGGQLTIVTRTEAGQIRLTVADSGTGISADNLPHVFDPFFTTKSDGSGLGLSLSREIAQRHGGRLDIRSESTPGTIATLFLPLTPAD